MAIVEDFRGTHVQLYDQSGNPLLTLPVSLRRDGAADGFNSAGTDLVMLGLSNGSTSNRQYGIGGLGDASGGTGAAAVGPVAFNGATYDRSYNNSQGTLLASAARTVQTDSANQTNYNARGVILFLNVTAASGTGGLTVQLRGVDPISGNSQNLANSAQSAITATGCFAYIWYPGTSGGGNGAWPVPVPRTWMARVLVGDASSYTYSIGYQLIV